jgi:hypothetical protein
MTTPAVVGGEARAASGSWRAWPAVRLLLAVGLTWGVLLYAWVRVLVFGMLVGFPEARYLALLAGCLPLVMLLTYRLSRHFPGPETSRFVVLALAAGWVGTLGVLVAAKTGTLLPRPVVAGLLIPATLWVPWTAWMLCWHCSRWRCCPSRCYCGRKA